LSYLKNLTHLTIETCEHFEDSNLFGLYNLIYLKITDIKNFKGKCFDFIKSLKYLIFDLREESKLSDISCLTNLLDINLGKFDFQKHDFNNLIGVPIITLQINLNDSLKILLDKEKMRIILLEKLKNFKNSTTQKIQLLFESIYYYNNLFDIDILLIKKNLNDLDFEFEANFFKQRLMSLEDKLIK
jgi:hypothetical protein